MKKKRDTDTDLCRCGHERKHHGKSTSINYTEGKCSKCKCQNFCMPRTDFRHPLTEIFLHDQETNKVTTIGGGDATDEDIWQQTQRFIDSIRDEIKSDNPDESAIDFWLFKIERRIEALKQIITKEK